MRYFIKLNLGISVTKNIKGPILRWFTLASDWFTVWRTANIRGREKVFQTETV